jgi:hypothetical protein
VAFALTTLAGGADRPPPPPATGRSLDDAVAEGVPGQQDGHRHTVATSPPS